MLRRQWRGRGIFRALPYFLLACSALLFRKVLLPSLRSCLLQPWTPFRRLSSSASRGIVHASRSQMPRTAEQGDSRSSFDSSPEWVKSVVSGLTSLVNGIMGNGDNDAVVERMRASETVTPAQLLEGIRADFEERQYLWSGDIDVELYDEGCTFTDPTLSFTGLSVFEKNIRNLRPILDNFMPEKRRQCILRGLTADAASGKVTAKWTMIGDLSLPWSPRIELGGRTTYTPGPDGRIVSYDENWDIGAGEALGQILTPRSTESPIGAEHWAGRLQGAPPPTPNVVISDGPTFVILPGFGNDAVDYVTPLGQDDVVGVQACMARRGCAVVVSPVQRSDWLNVFFRGLLDADFRAGNGTAPVAFGWYLDMAKELVEESTRASGQPVVLLGHSAGGWLARALMQREGRIWITEHIRGIVTLGTPHLPPPEGTMDMTQGCLKNLNKEHPGAFHSDLVFYVTVAGDAIVGEKQEGNLPILELIFSASPESTAFNSYSVVCGKGNVTGDGVVPLEAAHLDGAHQLTVKDCLHSINIAGTTTPTDRSYLCEEFVDKWLAPVVEQLRETA